MISGEAWVLQLSVSCTPSVVWKERKDWSLSVPPQANGGVPGELLCPQVLGRFSGAWSFSVPPWKEDIPKYFCVFLRHLYGVVLCLRVAEFSNHPVDVHSKDWVVFNRLLVLVYFNTWNYLGTGEGKWEGLLHVGWKTGQQNFFLGSSWISYSPALLLYRRWFFLFFFFDGLGLFQL